MKNKQQQHNNNTTTTKSEVATKSAIYYYINHNQRSNCSIKYYMNFSNIIIKSFKLQIKRF